MKNGNIGSLGSLDELQAAHQKWRHVSVRHAAFSSDEQPALLAFVESLGRNCVWGEGSFTLQVDEEQKIAALIRALVQARIDIYAVHAEEPSLERIFMEEESRV